MGPQDLENIKILNLYLENKIYRIDIPVKDTFMVDAAQMQFVLANRQDDEEIVLTSSSKDSLNEFTIFEIEIPFDAFKLSEDDIWDLYVIRETQNGLKKSRIKSNFEHLRILAIVTKENQKMFYPFTTKEGNLSFRFNQYNLFATFDDIQLTNSGEISVSGFFNYPPFHSVGGYNIKRLKLVINNNGEEEKSIDVKRVARPDLYSKYTNTLAFKEIGFEGSFDVKKYINGSNKKSFKFFLELEYEHEGRIETIRSIRVRLSHETELPDKSLLTLNGKKKKIYCSVTKKSKYFLVNVVDYNMVKETLTNIKSKWVKIRRSDDLKKMYKVVFYLLGRIMPADQKLVMFESFLGKQYSDSPRAIYEYMLENHPDYKMYWSVDRRHLKFFADKDVKYVRRFSISWLLLMTRAKYWVSNSRLPLWIPKPKHTIYLQTWHGTPLKRLAADMDEVHMPGTNTRKYKENFLREASKWDYLVSPNAYSSEIFQRAFAFDKKMIESGYPRNDFLINCNDLENMNQLKERMNLPMDKKIILYAPTWRDNQFYAKGKYKFDLQLDLDKIREELGDEYIVLLRMHYLVAENLDLSGYEDFVYDFSFHEDIRELYLISDILITDYSSVFFDYANLKRPMLFFVYDIDDYRDNLRGFYFDFEEKAPGPLTQTTEEIIKEIKLIEENGFLPSETTKEFYKKFCYLESGESSKRVVDEVFGK
ncbi:CDP-glycerol glycerophosphotransferase family protein [Bacillus sp. Marseille-Q3570]|uniref:CDP-glycerol glycerophosphotransferase family protein n=1 Tax=Bacillus sp. Marseille-Q3570 TaxID=2963522 RepID=UPI0021B70392|nr:CDP-glycerol glycerophosphotransferase family protein [Bacillus sp. Marseille-Q3570]